MAYENEKAALRRIIDRGYGMQPREDRVRRNEEYARAFPGADAPLTDEAQNHEHDQEQAQPEGPEASSPGSPATAEEEQTPTDDPAEDAVPVETEDGVIFVVAPETKPSEFILARRPELVDFFSAGTTYQIATGRFIQSWRKRRPEDGDAQVVNEPARPRLREPERVPLGRWGENRTTYRSTDPPSPASDRSHGARNSRFAVDDRNAEYWRWRESQQ
jgi:hypothetical protein